MGTIHLASGILIYRDGEWKVIPYASDREKNSAEFITASGDDKLVVQHYSWDDSQPETTIMEIK